MRDKLKAVVPVLAAAAALCAVAAGVVVPGNYRFSGKMAFQDTNGVPVMDFNVVGVRVAVYDGTGTNIIASIGTDGSASFGLNGLIILDASGVVNVGNPPLIQLLSDGSAFIANNKFAVNTDGSFRSDNSTISSDGSGNLTAVSFIGAVSGAAASHGVVALVSGTNQVASAYASATNAIICTPIVGDATNFTASVSNIVEGVSFTIFASTA